jgi:S-adenosylmethionine:tRNA ribosyltransferase-isomerase
MKLSEFDYDLPKELIAQYPAKERDKCRLMVLDRKSRSVEHRTFEGIAEYFKPGDCLVLNDTRVIPARLFGRRATGGRVELFLLEVKDPVSEALVRPSGRIREGEKISLESGDEVELLGRGAVGRMVRFPRPVSDIIREAGHVPLPPYIDRTDDDADEHDYQTVYGAKDGATASPTAGLHFTHGLLDKIRAKGVSIAYVTLHTNYGTFAPVKSEDVEGHAMHREYFELPSETERLLIRVKEKGGAIFAVGTTTTRVLEHCASRIRDAFEPEAAKTCSGHTDLFIYPGYRFKVVDHLITNFHLPKSTLMILVSAFAGGEFIKGAYRQAIEARYRFFSYGDAMLIL